MELLPDFFGSAAQNGRSASGEKKMAIESNMDQW
jgi:hypothetical protein